MTSIHPLTHITPRIQDRSVQQAFTKVTSDDHTPLEIDACEVDVLFQSASRDNPLLLGKDATLPRELRDLEMIRAEAGWLLRTPEARKKFDEKLDQLRALPEVKWRDDDGSLRTGQVAINKVYISGRAKGNNCPDGAMCFANIPSRVALEVDGQIFSVQPKRGQTAERIARALVKQLKDAGFDAVVERARGGSVVQVKRKADGLGIKNLTTDQNVQMSPQGNGQVRVSSGYGGPIRTAGGQIGLLIGGQRFEVATRPGESVFEKLDELSAKIEAGGFVLDRVKLPARDTIEEVWYVRKPGEVGQLSPGEHTDLQGTIVHHDENDRGPDGGYGAYGPWLELDRPIRVGDVEVSKVWLGYDDAEAGARAHFHGRLDVREGPQEIFPPIRFVELTGVSDLGKGEPKFDGREFMGATGKPLPKLTYDRPLIADAPAVLFVPDQGADKLFVGSYGGFIPPDRNPFHGFRGSAALAAPTRADQAQVRWTERGPVNAGGQPLTKIGAEPAPPEARDFPSHEWYFDPQAAKVYRFTSGGIAPPYTPTMTQVADVSDTVPGRGPGPLPG